jgi:mRNA deadenylase 3'-5' endonuclease subunit Ccr4
LPHRHKNTTLAFSFRFVSDSNHTPNRILVGVVTLLLAATILRLAVPTWKTLAPATVELGIATAAAAAAATSATAATTTTTTTTATTIPTMQIRVVSYNVLSSHLARPDYYVNYNPDHLRAEQRLPVVLEKLEEQRNKHTIFCLQEVSREWAGELHTYFSNCNYHFVTGLYGRSFNGYMGVGIAWPMDTFETVNVDIQRVSETNRYSSGSSSSEEGGGGSSACPGWPRAPPTTDESSSFWIRIPKQIVSTLITSWAVPLLVKYKFLNKPDVDAWEYSQWRENLLVSVELKQKQQEESSSSFWVSCYHMPCAFWAPAVMTMHAELATRHVQQTLANKKKKYHNNQQESSTTTTQQSKSESKSTPFILAGDWNIKPTDTIYTRLTTGQVLDANDPAQPMDKYGVSWKCDISPMTSAYAAVNYYNTNNTADDGPTTTTTSGSSFRKEPEFTNYAQVKDDAPFLDTLDYIFLSHDNGGSRNNIEKKEEESTVSSRCDWKVINVQSLPSKDKGPFPNLTVKEPSDHVLIAADLELVV